MTDTLATSIDLYVGRKVAERRKALKISRGEQEVDQLEFIPLSQKSDIKLSSTGFEAARNIAIEAGTGWDIYALEREWQAWAKEKKPENPEGAFIGFVKKESEDGTITIAKLYL